MQSYCKFCQIYRDSYNMDQQPVMWTNTSLRKPRVFLRYIGMVLKEVMQEETLPRRPDMEPRGMPKVKDSSEDSSSEGERKLQGTVEALQGQ
jgi:hypothetical protein